MNPVVTEEFFIPSDTENLNLFVRNKRLKDHDTFRAEKAILFVAGATYPASTTFDLALGDTSWMDHLARTGYDTYLVDVRGYGRSDRPAEMDEPAQNNLPIVCTEVAVGDVKSAIDFICRKRAISALNLIGWSWGTSLMARYTIANVQTVNKLVLVAPQWLRMTPSLADDGGTLGAYRLVTRSSTKGRWLNGVPEHKREKILPTDWFDAWADATFQTEPQGDRTGYKTLRAPNGTVADSRAFWASGKPLYNPSDITVPVMIIHGEWDQDCPLDMSRAVFSKLKAAPYKRWVEVGEATHCLFMESGRWQVFNSVRSFFDEVPPDGI